MRLFRFLRIFVTVVFLTAVIGVFGIFGYFIYEIAYGDAVQPMFLYLEDIRHQRFQNLRTDAIEFGFVENEEHSDSCHFAGVLTIEGRQKYFLRNDIRWTVLKFSADSVGMVHDLTFVRAFNDKEKCKDQYNLIIDKYRSLQYETSGEIPDVTMIHLEDTLLLHYKEAVKSNAVVYSISLSSSH